MTHAIPLYIALRRNLASPAARRVGEAARIPIEGRTCGTRLKKGRRCDSRQYRRSRERGPVCIACGRGWPTRVVIESVRGTRRSIPNERMADLAADLGALFARLPTWPRRVLMAWHLHCEVCGKHVTHRHGRWRHHEVAEHLAQHFPRAVVMTTPTRVNDFYADAVGEIEGGYVIIDKAYGRG